ncbi:MAG TPA: tetratricopeptide repeat protein [Streptosporangiaceae bacterium]
MNDHLWIAGEPPARDGISVDCHRRLRGPFTGLGGVLRALVPRLAGRAPALVNAHAFEILSVAPELRAHVDPPPRTLTEMSEKDERTRLYAPRQTRRLAHGAIDLLVAAATPELLGPLTLSFANADGADPTDQEFLALLLRRTRESGIRVIVHTAAAEPPGLPDELAAALRDRARRARRARSGREVDAAPDRRAGRTPGGLVRAFVAGDGVSADPRELAAYADAAPEVRAALHDERAAELARDGEWSLRLGAIPYHLERGGDHAAAVAALRAALDHCLLRGFYHAAIDYGLRGRAITDPDTDLDDYWYLSARTALAYSTMRMVAEAEPLDLEVRRRCAVPTAHMVTGYALAMMYTRHLAPELRDHGKAREYINNAIAIATLWPDPTERAFHTVFNRNGLALVEMHSGNLAEALRLVTDGLARLERELDTGDYRLHRSVLLHNRANVLLRLGRLDEALADFSAVIEMDPYYPEYHRDRAGVRRQLGDHAGALHDYDTAVSLSLPFWELQYNRGVLRAEAGDLAGAIADFSRVVELEPGELEPWISLVSLLLETGDLAAARKRTDQALREHPGDPQLLCVSGQVALEAGDADRAKVDFELALGGDQRSVVALAGRAMLAFQRGDIGAAVADLSLAIEVLPDDPDLLYNRGRAHQELRDWAAAVADFTSALALPGSDRAEILRQRGRCHAELGDAAASRADLDVAEESHREESHSTTIA